ncbi:protoporphyrinogen oxidase [uncultured Rubinisphaera sp.]|uniref:protoporphyrinogen oxidase n=2 Tax=Rubinisphaera TaxID=1649490 RepID=UPI0030D7D30D|tara:strand:+ start:5553 stop:7013 length:1461 start_codon:yes stop_codon:yes gene_type:complete
MNESPKTPIRWAVVGGGLSGLAACQHLLSLSKSKSTPVEIDLYEASDRLGGVFGTIEQDGYLLETGADMFITNKPAGLKLAKQLGLENRLIETEARYRKSMILREGRPVPTPAGFDLMAPRQLHPFLKSPILSAAGKRRVLKEYWIEAAPQEDESLQDFAVRRFGREAFERMIQPMIGGIYTADPAKLSLRATLPRFLEMEEQYGGVLRGLKLHSSHEKSADAIVNNQASGARYGMFLSFDRGMSVLQETLFSSIENEITLHKNSTVEKIAQQENGGYDVSLRNENTPRHFDSVIIAAPSYVAGKLLEELDSYLSSELNAIPYASAAIVVTGYPLSQIQHPMDCFGMVIPAIERRNILAVSCTSRKFPNRAPEGSIQLRTFIGGALQQHLLEKDDDELLAITQQELREIFGVEGTPETTHVVRWNRAMPQYHVGHLDRVNRIGKQLEKHPGLAVAGNALNGVGIPDVIQTAQASVEKCWTEITGAD